MIVFLSQLRINRHHPLAQHDLGDRHELHRTVLSIFPKQMPTDERILFRLEIDRRRPCAIVLIQSQTPANWGASRRLNKPGYLLQPPETRAIQLQIEDGMRLPFRLQAYPTVKWDGKRHAIYDDDRLMEWLQRKGEQHGFSIDPLHVRTVKLGNLYGRRRQQTWHVVQFDGLLEVVDAETFHSALRGGIGSAKAFGCGLLSVPYLETNNSCVSIFPTDVGVIRSVSELVFASRQFPHARGGDPECAHFSKLPAGRFPTDVGVIRRRKWASLMMKKLSSQSWRWREQDRYILCSIAISNRGIPARKAESSENRRY